MSKKDIFLPQGDHAGLDMSVATDPLVVKALPVLLVEWRMKKRWADMRPQTRALHQQVLINYLTKGAPPDIADLDTIILDDLQQRDLIVIQNGAIQSAYPFSTLKTGHRACISGISNWCVCAIDALGAPAMARDAAQVDLECAVCDAAITIRIGEPGLELKQSNPAAACIWAGIVPIKGCAAATQCQSMLAFCNAAHLQQWRNHQPNATNGFSFSIGQALQAGAAIFRPFLQSPL